MIISSPLTFYYCINIFCKAKNPIIIHLIDFFLLFFYLQRDHILLEPTGSDVVNCVSKGKSQVSYCFVSNITKNCTVANEEFQTKTGMKFTANSFRRV